MEFPMDTLGDTYGADSVQALQLAADIEPVLKRSAIVTISIFPLARATSMSKISADGADDCHGPV